jgi:spectinomycin phosphotransferase
VETPPPDAVAEPDLTAALLAGWAIAADSVRYVPKGFGSYHWIAERRGRPRYFITVDDLETKPWIASEHDATFAGLTAAYRTASVLHDQAGLHLVVAPLPSRDGRVTLRLSPQFSMAVFPFVVGQAGTWGDPLTPEARSRLMRDLAILHLATPQAGSRIPPRSLALPERPGLTEALGGLGRPWTEGPLAEPARRALADHAGRVESRLSAFDDLAGIMEESAEDPVVTHGEPHPGNLIHTAQGLRLIDWDTVALAAPERDLWMLDDRSPDCFALYSQLTGRNVNRAAISFYRLTWTLSDIASYVELCRSARSPTEWLEQKWSSFLSLLAGAASSPYAAA